MFQVAPRPNGEWNMTDVFQKLANDGKASTCLFNGRYFDCGSMSGYVLANLYFGLDNPEIKKQVFKGAHEILDHYQENEKELN